MMNGIGWIDVPQDRDRWRVLVNAVMKREGSMKCVEFIDKFRTCYILKDSVPWNKK